MDYKQEWEIGDDFQSFETVQDMQNRLRDRLSKRDEAAQKIQNFAKGDTYRRKLTHKKIKNRVENRAASKIQSKVRGNIKDRIDRGDPIRSVPYRNTNWKSMENKELPWNVEKRILKTLLNAENIDDTTDEINDLEHDFEDNLRELKELETIQETYGMDKGHLESNKKQLIEENKDLALKLQALEKDVKSMKQLDMFKCNSIKDLILMDPYLARDEGIAELIKPCKEDDLSIYINTFYALPWNLMIPSRDESIYTKIEEFPSTVFTNYGKSMLRYTLEQLGLMDERINHNNQHDSENEVRHTHNRDDYRWRNRPGPGPTEIRGAFTRFELLANYYKWSDYNRYVDLYHLKYIPYYDVNEPPQKYPRLPANRGNGRQELIQTLDLFEENVKSKKIVQGFAIPDPDIYGPFLSRIPPIGDHPEIPEGKTITSREGWKRDMIMKKTGMYYPYSDNEENLDLIIKNMKIYFIKALMGMDDMEKFVENIRIKIRSLESTLPMSVEEMDKWVINHYKKPTEGKDPYADVIKNLKKIKEYKYIIGDRNPDLTNFPTFARQQTTSQKIGKIE